jgi:hypothetical protein
VLIAGGLLDREADAIADAFAADHALVEGARRERGGWATLTLGRAPGRATLRLHGEEEASHGHARRS